MSRNLKTLCLLRYYKLICYVSNFNAVLQSFFCPNCDTFSNNRTPNWELLSAIISERVKFIDPRNVYQIWEVLFDQLDYFGIKYTRKKTLQKLSNFRFWINLCPAARLWRNKDNTVDGEAYTSFSIYFFKPCGKTNSSLGLWSSSPRCIQYWSNDWSFSAKQSRNEVFVPWFSDNN